MTMIEKVARAIGDGMIGFEGSWEDCKINAAKAAIEAMRNANAKMIRAGLPRAIDGYPIDVWHAMIDAALKD